MNVLVITAHPDDMEIYCGGTVAKCVKRGDNVTVCHVANGNMGHVVIMPDELREIRIKEAQRGGGLAGAKVVTIDVGDLLVDAGSLEQRNKLIDVIREAQPDFIITHDPNDYMLDHRAVSKLAFDASFAASCPHYGTDEPSNVTPIFYMDTPSSLSFVPTEFVDITDEFDLKIEMCKCHESQVKWLMDHDGIDFVDNTRVFARFRGMQCGVKYAEGFRQEMVDHRVCTKRLLP